LHTQVFSDLIYKYLREV